MPSPFLYLLTIAIQVFETTIRVLGGLLSGHIFANQTGQPFYLPWYRGELLNLAHDLGKRLLPAFATPTGLPIARVSCARLCGGY
jgi:ER degradation enhancer, mannosidase alpha-like 1